MPPGVRLRIISPGYSGFAGRYIDSLLQLRKLCQEKEIGFHWSCIENRADIVAVRNYIGQTFMQGDATHLLMPDSDIGWESPDVLKMIERDVPFAAAAPPGKAYRFDRYEEAVRAGKPDPQRVLGKYYVDPLPEDLALGRMSAPDAQGFVKIAAIGGAFLLIKRQVFETIEAKHPELHTHSEGHGYFERMIEDGTPFSEDKAFCRRWRAAGGDIHLLVNANLTHSGPYTFSGNFGKFAGLVT